MFKNIHEIVKVEMLNKWLNIQNLSFEGKVQGRNTNMKVMYADMLSHKIGRDLLGNELKWRRREAVEMPILRNQQEEEAPGRKVGTKVGAPIEHDLL